MKSLSIEEQPFSAPLWPTMAQTRLFKQANLFSLAVLQRHLLPLNRRPCRLRLYARFTNKITNLKISFLFSTSTSVSRRFVSLVRKEGSNVSLTKLKVILQRTFLLLQFLLLWSIRFQNLSRILWIEIKCWDKSWFNGKVFVNCDICYYLCEDKLLLWRIQNRTYNNYKLN